MRFASLFLKLLLLIGGVLFGSVPEGMMRHAGPDGIRLVLCTSDGTKEVWLRDDGTSIPVEEGEEQRKDGHRRHCVQVALASHDAPPEIIPRWHVLQRSELVLPHHQVTHRQFAGGPPPTRAPPVSV